MQRSLLFFAVIFAQLFLCGSVHAFAPLNDSVQHAVDLGPLPSPGLCPNAPKGDYDSLNGTTNGATFDLHDFSLLNCYSAPSPDVWYKFRATGAFLYVELTGLNGFQNFFLKIYYSEGSSISLLPGQCYTSSGNSLIITFPTPTINGEYYLEIGGDTQSNTGDFFMKYKNYNDCDGCVKRATMNFSPAPVHGSYNQGDTVNMCVRVDRWQTLTTSYIHGIVPEFGPDWDLASLNVTSSPITQSAVSSGEWSWFTGINTPAGTLDGFFFDDDNNGNPSDNHGDNGGVMSSWEGCWNIVALDTCASGDLSVRIHLYSDDETGNGSSFSVCNPYDILEVNTSENCCHAPEIVVSAPAGCVTAFSNVSVLPSGNSVTHLMNYLVIDDMGHIVQQANGVVGPHTFTGIPQGQYLLQCVDITSGCTSYIQFTVHPQIDLQVDQTATGCGSGTGTAFAYPAYGGNPPFTFNWLNVPIANQNDSVAWALQDGWVYVNMTDAAGCTVSDSVFITSIPTPDPTFGYDANTYCANTDTIHVTSTPPSHGGTYSLSGPLASNIVVDPSNGDIFLNNTTHPTPFYVYVTYTVNDICSASYVDSVLVVGVPAAPVATSASSINWCIGSTAPVLSVTVPNLTIGSWYDSQTMSYSVGNSYTPPLNASSLPGVYTYGAFDVSLTAGNCASTPIIFIINVLPTPSVTASSNPFICQGDTAFIYTSGCSSCAYQWSPTPTSGIDNLSYAVTSPSSTVVYSVNATDQNGCSATAYSVVTVGTCGTGNTFQIYSGLTPNGDGINDHWIIDGVDSLMHVNVQIFNRWGVEVWENSDYNNVTNVFTGVDAHGNELTDGTYYYIVTLNNEQHTGWMELSRK